MQIADGHGNFQFDLPTALIAQDPPARRGDSRLLLVEPDRGRVGERAFRDLPDLLRAGDLLVVNESRVLPARLWTRRRDTGGKVEILLIRPTGEACTWLAMARPGRRLRPGVRVALQGSAPRVEGPELEIIEQVSGGTFLVRGDEDPGVLAESWGVMPLPPYIKRDDPEVAEQLAKERAARDRERYQTVYADGVAGSVAAPTAGLHFSASTMGRLAERGVGLARVQLHVGPGTFQPPTAEQIAIGRLHQEHFRLPAETARIIRGTRADGGRVIAVGTTSLRVLETVERLGLDEGGPDDRVWPTSPDAVFTGRAFRTRETWEVEGATRLFVQPPEQVRSVDGLVTNFHLPGSSLIMLVASFMGGNSWRSIYENAVAAGLRFYSYGDCMLIMPGLAGTAEDNPS